MSRRTWGDYPVVKVAGREFQKVPRSVLPFWREGEGDELVMMPVLPPDDKKEFPGRPAFEGIGPLLQSGISQHKLDFMRVPAAYGAERSVEHFTATDLVVLDEVDWYGECFCVLEAHGWTDHGEITSEMIQRIIEAEDDPGIVARSQAEHGDNHKTYLLEKAAKHFAPPLSRLWYVANMMSLFYCHYDDMRFGYLWAEYQIKMRAELFALKHQEMSERNRENGAKGGQRDKKLERYQVLNHLGRQRFKDLAFASDRDAVRLARQMAAQHDKGADDPLFAVNGKDLSRNWYEEWLSSFRRLARGIE